jgi:hypothetical protein
LHVLDAALAKGELVLGVHESSGSTWLQLIDAPCPQDAVDEYSLVGLLGDRFRFAYSQTGTYGAQFQPWIVVS